MFSSLVTLAVSALVSSPLAHSMAVQPMVLRQYQDPNSPLLVDYPSCAFYKCIVDWTHGQQTYVNWINAPNGDVQIDLMTNDNNDVAYPIANTTSPSPSSTCDSGQGEGVAVQGKACGRFTFIVPTEWTPGRNYSVRAFLKSNPSIESYTDVIQLHPAAGNPEPNIPFSTVSPSGNSTSTSSAASSSATNGTTASASSSPNATSAASPTGAAAASGSSSASNGASRQIQGFGMAAIATLAASLMGAALFTVSA